MAPEMVAGTGHDKMVDIWALGALLHEMVTGESPFARYGQVLVGAEKQWLPDADLRIMAKIATLLRKVCISVCVCMY
jgi:serine/threonine protein kinase